jgi:hypothetical protein
MNQANGTQKENFRDSILSKASLPNDPIENELYPEEISALSSLKRECDLCAHYSDKFLMRCLFARKLDVRRAHKLVKQNWKWRCSRGLQRVPSLEEVKGSNLWKAGFGIPGVRTKDGALVIYLLPGRVFPEETDVKHVDKLLAYFFLKAVDSERIDAFRYGAILVGRFNDFGRKNFDFHLVKEIFSCLQDVFPLTYKQILIWDPPPFINWALSASRFFIKRKIYERIRIVGNIETELHQVLDPKSISSLFGGQVDFGPEDFKSFFESWEFRAIQAN